ncbi:MAG: hypothetical protein Kow0042_05640 [Calditrichia bacterium]
MKHLPKLNHLLSLLIPSLIILMIFFMACEKEVEKIVTKIERDTVTVVQHDTTYINVHDTTLITIHDTIEVQIISVDTLVANPDSITQGGTIQLTAQVSTLPMAGDSLLFFWNSAAGTFDNDRADTVNWKAPDDAGTYRVTVHVTDGEYIAIGSRNIGVGMYAATVTPYYVGDAACTTCHNTTHTTWEMTGHAEAWASLQSSDHAAPYCTPCHTVDTEQVPGNAGYDDAPIAKYQNVQCENCHGHGSDHISNPGGVDMSVNIEIATCGICHEGGHHPYQEQWEQSGHNFDPAVAAHGAGLNAGCQPCHSGTGFVEAFPSTVNPSGTHYITWAGATNKMGVTCSVCHDPHGVESVHQLRTTADVTLVSGEVISGNGAGQLCIQCHHARRSPLTQIVGGYAHFGPHPGTQGDVVYGSSAYEDINPNMTFASSGHGLVADACASCHVYMTEYDPITQFANVGHTFEPRVEACQSCHGSYVTSFEDIMAKNDFDNDGTTEALRHEVEGLMELLATKLYEADTNHVFMGTDPNASIETIIDSLSATTGDSSDLAVKLRKGGYNLTYVFDDGSEGIHNPVYVVQLLQQSILFLDPNALSYGILLRDDKATTLTAISSQRR